MLRGTGKVRVGFRLRLMLRVRLTLGLSFSSGSGLGTGFWCGVLSSIYNPNPALAQAQA